MVIRNLVFILSALAIAHGQQCTRFKAETDNSPNSPKYVNVDITSDGVCESYRLYFVTYATSTARADFCITATSAVAHGFEINVLGLQRQAEFNINGPLDKLWAIQDFLRIIPDHPNVLVTFVDAYDTIVNGSPKALVKRLLASGHRVLFASEKGCCSTKWAMMKRENTCDDEWPIPPIKTTSPHLNSGGFIGFRRELIRLMDLSSSEYNLTISELSGSMVDPYKSGGDQMLICQLFSYGGYGPNSSPEETSTIRKELGMSIDYKDKLFKCMYDVHLDDEVTYTESGRLVSKGISTCNHLGKRFFYPCLGVEPEWSYPVVLHFNGADIKKTKPLRTVAKKIRLPPVDVEALWNVQFWDGITRPGGAGARLGDSCQHLTTQCSKKKPILKCLAKHIKDKI